DESSRNYVGQPKPGKYGIAKRKPSGSRILIHQAGTKIPVANRAATQNCSAKQPGSETTLLFFNHSRRLVQGVLRSSLSVCRYLKGGADCTPKPAHFRNVRHHHAVESILVGHLDQPIFGAHLIGETLERRNANRHSGINRLQTFLGADILLEELGGQISVRSWPIYQP